MSLCLPMNPPLTLALSRGERGLDGADLQRRAACLPSPPGRGAGGEGQSLLRHPFLPE
ncbi:hypothetical protein D9M68_205400 [compost metagenome]